MTQFLMHNLISSSLLLSILEQYLEVKHQSGVHLHEIYMGEAQNFTPH